MSNLVFHPPVIAHRGARTTAPENTLSALRLAKEQGAAWVEFDVKLTHDGIPILMHDDTLDRTTNGHGAVADTSWAHIQTLDAGSWFNGHAEKVPHLKEAIQTVLDCGLRMNLELKPCPTRARATTLVALMETAQLWHDHHPLPLISSFDAECLQIAAQFQPHWPRSLLLEEWSDDWRAIAALTKASVISLSEDQLTQPRVQSIAEKDFRVLAYTVNDPKRARELLSWGVDAVFSDNPQEMIRNLG